MNAQTKQQARTSDYSERAMANKRDQVEEVMGEIAAVRWIIHASDVRRQQAREPVNTEWVADYRDYLDLKKGVLWRFKSELREMERAAAAARVVTRDEFRDTLLAVVRIRHDEDTWEQFKADARRLIEMTQEAQAAGEKEVSHG